MRPKSGLTHRLCQRITGAWLAACGRNGIKKAEVLEPRNIYLEVEQARNALTLQEWQQATVLTDDVVARNPQDPRRGTFKTRR